MSTENSTGRENRRQKNKGKAEDENAWRDYDGALWLDYDGALWLKQFV